MKRARKMRAYLTRPQQVRATQMLHDHCILYNAALQERRGAWKLSQESIGYGSQSAQLRDIRSKCPEQSKWSFTSQQQTLRRLNRSFEGFFRRVKAGQTAGYPRYRSRHRFDTVDHVNGDGAKWKPTEGKWAKAYFQGVGHVKVSEHTPIEGRVSQMSLKREGRRWYVIVIENCEPELLDPTGNVVGIDVGIARFATTSDGDIVPNPRFTQEASKEMAELQRRLAKCKQGSGNYRRVKRQIGKLYRKVKNQRRDFHHKVSRQLIDHFDVIAVEKLNVVGMSKRAAPKPNGQGGWLPNGAAAKTGLNRSILDVGWAQFISILNAKAEWAGRQVIQVNPAYTSINCHKCKQRCTRPQQNTVICADCGPFDADLNGAKNILSRAGLGSSELALAS